MAETLEDYVQQDYERERAPLEEIRELTEEAFKVLAETFLVDDRSWPYEIVDDLEPHASSEYTFSTNAMIAFALKLLAGRIITSSLVPAAVTPPDPGVAMDRFKRVGAIIDEAVAKMIDEAEQLPSRVWDLEERGHPPPPSPPYTWSGTFGWDDPFTYNWLLELLADDQTEHVQAFRDDLCDRGAQLVEQVLTSPQEPFLKMRENQEVEHSFPRLRVLQLRETIRRITGSDPAGDIGDVRINRYLLDRVHRQLSESQSAEGDFDPADLVFALEGWIMTSPDKAGIGLVERTFEALRLTQQGTAYWRPLLPFKATQQGLVLLPQSVEIANSLLRICGMKSLSDAGYFSQHLELFEPYRKWLIGRVFRGLARRDDATLQFVGWESEHTHRLDRIHLWQTSQVLIFLQHYAAMLKQHLARKLLRLGNLIPDRTTEEGSPEARQKRWSEFLASEPFDLAEPGSVYRVYEQIDARFVKQPTDSAAFSLLLYGPPGTGKSFIAKQLSKALGFPMLTITPSDFVTSGGEAVEARTKAIFTALGEQTRLVVLFDEIDQLLLDRNSKLYREQGDVFKQLTPGMLAKLVKLGEQRSVIFVIATNYFERIDRAIRRAGRIDARYVVLPPSSAQRRRHVGEKLDGWVSLAKEEQDELVRSTNRFTYSELDTVIQRAQHAWGVEGMELAEALRNAIREDPPIGANEGYETRLVRIGDSGSQETEAGAIDRPLEEIALLVRLDLESGFADQPAVVREAVEDALESRLVKDPTIADDLTRAMRT